MKKKFTSISLLVVAGALATGLSAARADEPAFTIAGGGGAKNGSVYSAMIGDLAGTCSTDELALAEVQTSGGTENLALLKANKVKAAVVPNDILLAAKLENASSVATIKALFPLHPEDLHLIARADTKKEGGYFGTNVGAKDVAYNQVEDLRGRAIGAVGGSVTTLRILRDFLKVDIRIEEYKATAAMVTALTNRQIDAALIVAGQPSPAVEGLPAGQFKFLPLRLNQDLAAVYSPDKIQYGNVSGGRAVDTISTRALLVTRQWKSDEMHANLAKLRACFKKNLAKIQDKEGTHAAWQKVDLAEMGKWDYYDLPNLAPAGAAAPVKAKAKK